jgi:hypothetical protein
MKHNRTITVLIAAVLIAVLVAPAMAYAVPGRGRMGAPKPSAEASKQARFQNRGELLSQRVTMVMGNRTRAFNNIAARLTARIDRVARLADKAEAANGDVSAVRTSLDKARTLVADAKVAQLQAVALFKAVPGASDKKAAFTAARAQAKVAMKKLQEARLTLRKAILDLRAVLNGLKAAQQ